MSKYKPIIKYLSLEIYGGEIRLTEKEIKSLKRTLNKFLPRSACALKFNCHIKIVTSPQFPF